MHVGLMIDPIDPDISYVDNLKKAANLGFKTIQLWYRDIAGQIGEQPGSLKRLLDDFGLELKSLAAYMDILDPKKSWDNIFLELKKAVDYASSAGVRFVVTESGGIPGKMDDWDELIERFRHVSEYAQSMNVTILVENGPGVLVNSVDLMKRMMLEVGSEYLGINFDPANLNLVPEDVIDAVYALREYIRDTHAKDSILLASNSERAVPPEHIFVPPEGEDFIHIPDGVQWALPPVGEGDVPFPKYISALKDIQFAGDLIIEYQGGGKRENAIVKSKKYLERILQN